MTVTARGPAGGDRPERPAVSNIVRDTTVYGNVIQVGNVADLPPGFLPPSATVPGQLPAATPAFTGRDEELSRVLAVLDPAAGTDVVPIAAISGMAGMGKTELAKQVGHVAVARGWFPGGVIFLDMHGYDPGREPVTASAAVDQALRALGVAADEIPRDPEKLDERAALYRSKLAAALGPVLVVADNARHATQIEPLRPGASRPGTGGHRMIVTSRDTFPHFGGELINLCTLAEPDAVALLDAALRRARPGDDRISAGRQAAASVAQMCGCLPLTLQIAAARLKKDPDQPVAEFADRLRNAPSRLAALDDGHRGVIPVFEVSYRALEPRAARIFRLFTVNRGPDLSTSAVAVLANEDEEDVRAVLDGLADGHIIERVATVRGRWRMHDLLHDYARQVADEESSAGDADGALDRLAGYYLENAEAANLSLIWSDAKSDRFPTVAAALGWLEAEYPNLVAITLHAQAVGRNRTATDLAKSLAAFLSGRGHVADLLATTEAGRVAARDLGDDSDEALMLIAFSGGLRTARRFEDAAAACRQAAGICERAGDVTGKANALTALAAVLIETRSFGEALAVCECAKNLLNDSGEKGFAAALVRNNYGLALAHLDRDSEALPLFRRSVEMLREIDTALLGMALNNLGVTLLKLDEAEEAVTTLSEAVSISRESGLLAFEVRALANLAAGLEDTGQRDDALAAIQEALTRCHVLGNRRLEAEILLHLDNIQYQMGRYQQSLAAGREAAQIYTEIGDSYQRAVALRSIGQTLRRLKRRSEAAGCFREAADCFRASMHQFRAAAAPKDVGSLLQDLGGALRDSGDHAGAATAFLQATGLLWEAGEESSSDRALDSLGNALKKLRRFSPAEIVRAAQGYPGDAVTMMDLSIAMAGLSRYGEAEALCRQAADRCRASGDRRAEGMASEYLSSALRGLKRHEEAMGSAQEALVVAQETGNQRAAGSAWNKIGRCQLAMGCQDEAIDAFRTAAEIHASLGAQYLLAGSLVNIGEALMSTKRWDEAAAAFTEAVAIYHDVPARDREATATRVLSFCLCKARRYDEAVKAARQAQEIFEARGESWEAGLARGMVWRARLHRFRRRKLGPSG